MAVTSEAKAHFDKQYTQDAFFVPRDIRFVIYNRDIWDFFKTILEKSQRIADFGAGGGTLLFNVAAVTEAELIAVEFSDSALQQLKKVVPRAVIYKEDVVKTTLTDGCLDTVLSVMTIEHVDDHALLREIQRVLKTGGYALITTVLKGPRAWYFYRGADGSPRLEPTHLREYASQGEFAGLLESHNFRIIKSTATKIKFPLLDPIFKPIFRLTRSNFWHNLPASRLFEALRKFLRVPIPGYYALEVVAQKV